MPASAAIAARGPGTHQWKLLPTVKVRWPREIGSVSACSAPVGAASTRKTNPDIARKGTVLCMVSSQGHRFGEAINLSRKALLVNRTGSLRVGLAPHAPTLPNVLADSHRKGVIHYTD